MKKRDILLWLITLLYSPCFAQSVDCDPHSSGALGCWSATIYPIPDPNPYAGDPYDEDANF